MGAVAYFHHPSSLEHDTGLHPERADRIRALEAALKQRGWAGLERRDAPRVKQDTLLAVHPRDYVRSIEVASLRGGALDPDTIVSEGSYEAALHSAGGAVAMVDLLVGERSLAAGFCGLRPPGHWVTWVGSYPDRATAQARLAGVTRRAPGAYITLIRPRGG